MKDDYCPCIAESLESRKLMSAAFMAGSTLVVLGDHRIANAITVDYTDSTKSNIEVKITTTAKHRTSTLDKIFSSTAIDSVYIRGGMHADDILVADNGISFNRNARIDALGGNDTVVTNDAAGSTMLVYGGLGDDHLTVGTGNDSVWGGRGADVITAGNGNDIFGCVLGHNTVTAGSGHNTYHLRSLAANTTNYDPTKDMLVIVKKELDAPSSLPSATSVGA